MKKPLPITIMLLATLVTALLGLVWISKKHHTSQNTLTLYCAASFQPAIEEIAQDFTSAKGISIRLIYNGSGALLSQIQTHGGDLYLPANDQYTEDAEQLDLIASKTHFTQMHPVIVTHANTPKTIRTLSDLARHNLTISYPDSSSAIGKWITNYLAQHNLYNQIQPQIIVTKPTVNAVLSDVAIGSADATFAWNSVAHHFPNLTIIEDPQLSKQIQKASLSILKTTKHPEKAKQFLDYIRSPQARNTFTKHGFSTPQ